MVILRLRRGGRRHQPHYRLVAQEKRSKLNGAYIESVGHYHPADRAKSLVIDKDKVKRWLERGAQLSVTVQNLLVKEGILPKKMKISRVYRPKKKDEETTKAETKAEAKTETKVKPSDETKKTDETDETDKTDKTDDKEKSSENETNENKE